MKVIAAIQCTDQDLWGSNNEEDYVIHALRKVKKIDHIVCCYPDNFSSINLQKEIKNWENVEGFAGDVFNVCERLYKCAQKYSADIIVRVLLRQFYLDVDNVNLAIEKLIQNNVDYIKYPLDYNYALAADIYKSSALEKVLKLTDDIKDEIEKSTALFSPGSYIEKFSSKNFKLAELENINKYYSIDKANSIRSKLDSLQKQNQVSFESNYSGSSYNFITKLFNLPNAKVLDIACGQGHGSKKLSENGYLVNGLDISSEYINGAKSKYHNLKNLSFKLIKEDEFDYGYNYNYVVSLHTLEHVKDPKLFIKTIYESLLQEGYLYIEVPILLPYPMGMPLVPSHDKEYSINELNDLYRLQGFKLCRCWGKSRHLFIELKRDKKSGWPLNKQNFRNTAVLYELKKI